MEKTETLNEFLLFDTPEDMKDLMARIECLNGSERAIATLFAFMAFNLAAKIAKLNKQKAALRAEAIELDFAYYVQTTRDIAPNLSWWKENRPQSWQRFTSTTTVNKFTWK